jgi:putative hydrolase of HD superfamily
VRDVLIEALALKALPRAGWLRAGVQKPESVAAHSWGVAWLVANLCPAELNREKALMIALVHDLAEVRVGDITPHVQPMPNATELRQAFADYGSTPEGRFVKACDKLDMALQAHVYAADGVDTDEFIASALGRLQGQLADLAQESS